MSVDEPFYFDDKRNRPRPMDDWEQGQLTLEISLLQTCSYASASASMRLVEEPSNAPLDINRKWDLNRKFAYARARQANAVQLFEARSLLGVKGFTLATAVNVQRLLEGMDFTPRRTWLYYPIVDKNLGCGVPRSQTEVAMLKFAQVAITSREGDLLAYQAGNRSVTIIEQEQFE